MKAPGSVVLIVDDDANHREMLSAVIRERVEKIITAASGEEALGILENSKPDLILLDMRMPGMGGIGFLREYSRREQQAPVIVVTAFAEVEQAVEAMKLGATDYLSKPIELDVLESLLDRFVQGPAKEMVADNLPTLPTGAIFVSPLMKQVLRELAAAAPSNAAVLMAGESGTGKEILADLVHRWSGRAQSPLVRINMAAMPQALVESELFGHEKGAFTGAVGRRIGVFEQARGGTLFLDEIGELPLEVQPKLLRALETGVIRRLGGNEDIPVDLRLLSATNKDLAEEVEQGFFRKDLYYRLAVFVVDIPPLRERPEDITPLAKQFLGENEGPQKNLSQAAKHCLLAYHWPGNVRELRNSVQRAAIIAPGELVLPDHLPPALRELASQPSLAAEVEEPRALAEIEKKAIYKALERCGGNRTRAARELGISRRKLLYRLKDYDTED